MPPRKKRKSSPGAPKEPEEPLDFVAHIREKAQKRFASRRKNVNYDIEQNVREIRALLNINAEIFGRVIDSASNYGSGEYVTLTRYGFDVVKVRQSGESTEFVTEPARSSHCFAIDALCHLPHDLNGFLVVQYQAAPFNKFIDYNAFFRSALMLHEDILEPFLVKLKDHVEAIHVLLGEMESWLLESQRKIEFIETTFDTKLETPSPGDLFVEEASDCNCSARHYGFTRCLRCNTNFETHTRDAISGYYLCNQSLYPGKRFRCTKRVPKIHILKKYDHDGKFEKTFQITTESEQAKLKKCLEYMDS